MAKVTIGEVEYHIPTLNFAALELAWPYIEIATSSNDPMAGPSAGVGIVAAGLMEAEGFDRTNFGMLSTEALATSETHARVMYFLKRKLLATQIGAIREVVNEIIVEAGLVSNEGENPPVEETTMNPSPETVLASSLNSLQPVAKEEAGTP